MSNLSNILKFTYVIRLAAMKGLCLALYYSSGNRYLLFISLALAPLKTLHKIFISYGLTKDKKHNMLMVNNIKSFLLTLGPIFIKFGQTLSTRPDLVGADLANELRIFQDKLPSFSTDIVKQIILQELQSDCSKLFKKFSEKPIASASIAQVHKATLFTGEEVAVKVLRPEIKKIYEKDINLLYFIARTITKLFKKSRRLRLVQAVEVFHKIMANEINLLREAASCSELKSNLKNNDFAIIPKVYWQYSCDSVLVVDWIDGVSVYDTDAINKFSIDKNELVRKIALLFFEQVFRDGFFHADLHPGNMVICKDGRLALFDFGIMGRLNESDRLAIAEVLHAILNRDYIKVADIHIRVKYVPEDTDRMSFAHACRAVMEPILNEPQAKISLSKLLSRLIKITKEFNMVSQTQLVVLQKTLVVVEGLGQHIIPEVNMWILAEPWIKKWAIKNLTLEAKIIRYVKKIITKIENDLT